jgi:hypothetical protein
MMGHRMGEGERLHAERRNKFWRILGGLLLLGFVTGLISGGLLGITEKGPTDWPAWVPIAGTIGIVLVAIGLIYGSWRFFVSVDEVEVADNLWGSLVGFYAYSILFPGWWGLHRLGVTPEPDHWVIFGAAMCIAVLVYFYRKLRYS